MTESTVAEVMARAVTALERLATLGEEVEDEWQYVTDLVAVYRGRFGQIAAARAADPVTPETARAIDLAIEEAGLITDPHRAIDWLSTLPQIVLFTLGEAA